MTPQTILVFLLPLLDPQATGCCKYLHARSQSDRKQHKQTGLLQQVEENQQGTETTPQHCKQKGRTAAELRQLNSSPPLLSPFVSFEYRNAEFLTRLPGHSDHALLLPPKADIIFKSQEFTDELQKKKYRKRKKLLTAKWNISQMPLAQHSHIFAQVQI